MGLDIIAYKKLHIVENPKLDDDGYPVNWETEWIAGASMDWSESVWAGRGEGVDSKAVYTYEDRYDFRAGSYGGYNAWRDSLDSFKGNVAFNELINFADNEGVIGSIVSAKLFNDFKTYEKEAIEFSETLKLNESYYYGEFWLARYYDWMKAFEYASNGGAVNFC